VSALRCAKAGCGERLGRLKVDPFSAAVDRIGAEAFIAMSPGEQVQFAREHLSDDEVEPPMLVTDRDAREVGVSLRTGVPGGWLLGAPTDRETRIRLPATVTCSGGHPNEIEEGEDGEWTATKWRGLFKSRPRRAGSRRGR